MDDALPGSRLDGFGAGANHRGTNSPDDADWLYHQFPSQEAQYLSTPGRSQAGSRLRLMRIRADKSAVGAINRPLRMDGLFRYTPHIYIENKLKRELCS